MFVLFRSSKSDSARRELNWAKAYEKHKNIKKETTSTPNNIFVAGLSDRNENGIRTQDERNKIDCI